MTAPRLILFILAFSVGMAPAFAQEAPAIKLAPHRAIYKVTLASAKNTVGIHDVSGTMLFEITDACDGWAVQQHMHLRFSFPEGDTSQVASDIVTWESKDGRQFHFNVKRDSNDKENELFKGRASVDDQGGAVRYTLPAEKGDAQLSKDTIFPMYHTQQLIQKAMTGEKLFSRRVFDGSDEEGIADVSAFIGDALDSKKKDDGLSEELLKKPLLSAHKVWPMRLAFYPLQAGKDAGEPDYEMDLMMQDNGVARIMTIDYGDFAVTGTLLQIEEGQALACPGAQ